MVFGLIVKIWFSCENMVSLNIIKNTDGRNAVDGSFRIYQQQDFQNKSFILRFFGKAKSHFVFGCLFNLNYSKTIKCASITLGTIYCHSAESVIRGLMMSQ